MKQNIFIHFVSTAFMLSCPLSFYALVFLVTFVEKSVYFIQRCVCSHLLESHFSVFFRHYPKTGFTSVADTPENIRLKQQSKMQSQVR